jgi:formate/nitrite transporter FocA (FNT family)
VSAPEPEQIYERTREEGRRRLSRPVLELAATALVGGFDVAFGIAVYGLTAAAVAPRAGTGVAHLSGSIGFGIAFVFIVVGRSELFTENFLVPITGLSRRRDSWLKLGELWAVSLVLNRRWSSARRPADEPRCFAAGQRRVDRPAGRPDRRLLARERRS